jgi:hypothetical protein
VLAPLHALERSRGRRRLLLLLLYTLALLVLAALVWWAASLNGLPDLGDPFDPAEFDALLVPEDENAFTLYREASAKRVHGDPTRYRVADRTAWDATEWSKADPEVRRWVGDNAEAFDLWMRGADRGRGLFLDPRTITYGTFLEGVQNLREFARMGLLVASRRRDEGDVAGAWAVYRAILRASRHAGQGGGVIARIIGMAMLARSSPAIESWADDPRVSVAMLRQALDDVRAVRLMTAPPSETVKVEYQTFRDELRRPEARDQALSSYRSENHETWAYLPGTVEFLWVARREPERSLRVARIFYAGWLAHADEPPSRRPPPATGPEGGLELFPLPPDAPAAARLMSPAELDAWFRSAMVAGIYLPSIANLQSVLDRDVRAVSALELSLASKLYEREHGAPPKAIRDLVGPYLDRVPEGYEALDDPATEGRKP